MGSPRRPTFTFLTSRGELLTLTRDPFMTYFTFANDDLWREFLRWDGDPLTSSQVREFRDAYLAFINKPSSHVIWKPDDVVHLTLPVLPLVRVRYIHETYLVDRQSRDVFREGDQTPVGQVGVGHFKCLVLQQVPPEHRVDDARRSGRDHLPRLYGLSGGGQPRLALVLHGGLARVVAPAGVGLYREAVVRREGLQRRRRREIAGYKAQDAEAGRDFKEEDYITCEWVKKMLWGRGGQNMCCAVRECMRTLLTEWDEDTKDEQFIVDRLNNDLPHTRDNCRLTCVSCNHRLASEGKKKMKKKM